MNTPPRRAVCSCCRGGFFVVKYLQKSSQSFQLFYGICIFQLFLPCRMYRPHRLRMLADDHAAALALGQGTQIAEITASEQNGTFQPPVPSSARKPSRRMARSFRPALRNRAPSPRGFLSARAADPRAGRCIPQGRAAPKAALRGRGAPCRSGPAGCEGWLSRPPPGQSRPLPASGSPPPGPRGRASLMRPAPGR